MKAPSKPPSTSTHNASNLSHILALIDTFDVDPPANGEDRYFLAPDRESLARQLGDLFWLPLERAYTIFCYAYSALFGIPAFTQEALARHPERFSPKRLPLTIRSTAGFVLEAFGFDRRTNRKRDAFYLPGPVIRTVHADQPKQDKRRISNPAMAYFGFQLIRAAEHLSGATDHEHFLFIGDFFRTANYPFPKDRNAAEAFAQTVDQTLAGSTCGDLWFSVQQAAPELNVTLNLHDLASVLPKQTGRFFRQIML